MKDNNELEARKLENAESASLAVAGDMSAEEEMLRLRKIKLIKFGAVVFLSAVMLVFMTMHMITKQMTAKTA